MVSTGEQHCPGRRAGRGGVEVTESHPSHGQSVQVRRIDLTTVAAQVGISPCRPPPPAKYWGDPTGGGARRVCPATKSEGQR